MRGATMVELAIVIPVLIIFMAAALELLNVLRVWNVLSSISKDTGREMYQSCVRELPSGITNQACLNGLFSPGSSTMRALASTRLQGNQQVQIVGSIYTTSPLNVVSIAAQQNSGNNPAWNSLSRVNASLLQARYLGGSLGRVPNQGFAVSEVFYTYQPLFGVSFPFVDAFIRNRNGVVYEVTVY